MARFAPARVKASAALAAPSIAMSYERGNPPAATVHPGRDAQPSCLPPQEQDRRVVSDAPNGNGSNIRATTATKRRFSDLCRREV